MLAGGGEAKAEAGSVEELAGEVGRRNAIGGIADDGEADSSQVDAYLVSTAGLRPDFQQTIAADVLKDTVFRAGFTASRDHSHTLAVTGVAADSRLDNAAFRSQLTLYQHDIRLGDRMRLKLAGEVFVGEAVLGYNDESRRIFVKSMHDAGSDRISVRQSGQIVQNGVHQGMRRVAGGGVHRQTGRFIHDEKVGVLIDDLQGNCLGGEGRGKLRGYGNIHPISNRQFKAGFYRAAVDGDKASGDELLGVGAGQLGAPTADELIEANPRNIRDKAI